MTTSSPRGRILRLLDSLGELVSEHEYEPAHCDARDGNDHHPGEEFLADVQLTDPSWLEEDIFADQRLDTVKKGYRTPLPSGQMAHLRMFRS